MLIKEIAVQFLNIVIFMGTTVFLVRAINRMIANFRSRNEE